MLDESMKTYVFVSALHVLACRSSVELAEYLSQRGLDVSRPFERVEVRRQCECMVGACRLPHVDGLMYVQDAGEYTYSAQA